MVILDSAPVGDNAHAAGRALLERLYRAHTGLPLPEIRVTERGKPYSPGNPLYFSISHSKSRVFCALSDRPIGIDAEDQGRQVRPGLAEKVLSPAEYRRYAQAEDRQAALLRLWVLKEASAKCSGEGLRGYPNHTDFSPDDPRIQVLHGCFVAVVEE